VDHRLIAHYNRELAFIQEMGGEFASHYPKVAARLGMEGLECADPYVERLLEGFAFLSARIQLKMEEEFPQFCQHLLEIIYPDYLAPLPSMAVVQCKPGKDDPGLAKGHVLERGSSMRSGLGANMQTACEYRSAQDVTLFPLEVTGAEYLGSRAQLASIGVRPAREVMAGIRIRCHTTAEVKLGDLQMNELPLHIGGSGTVPLAIYEHILGCACGLSLVIGKKSGRTVHELGINSLHSKGFEGAEALLNYRSRSFDGYRLLREYFAFPERFRFVEFSNLAAQFEGVEEQGFDLVIHLSTRNNELENAIDAKNFLPFCTPVINLFPKRADRVRLNDREHEFHVVPDRARPMDFEIHQVLEVTGFGTDSSQKTRFLPFYALQDQHRARDDAAFYTLQRRPRLISSRQKQKGARSRYLGQEIYLSLVDAQQAPYASDLDQLGVKTMCTNRDLPLLIPLAQKGGDFFLDHTAPVTAINVVAGPTRPSSLGLVGETSNKSSAATSGDLAWRLINHLSLNYLSLIENDKQEGASALREMLELYTDGHALMERQINGILSVETRAVTRRLEIAGPISFGRGLEIIVVLDEAAFEAGGMVLFGKVLSEFFRKYVSLNNITETVIRTDTNVEVARWPVRMGRRPTA